MRNGCLPALQGARSNRRGAQAALSGTHLYAALPRCRLGEQRHNPLLRRLLVARLASWRLPLLALRLPLRLPLLLLLWLLPTIVVGTARGRRSLQ